MKADNYLTPEQQEEIKNMSLKEKQLFLSKPEHNEILDSSTLVKTHVGMVSMYLSQTRETIQKSKPDSKFISEFQTVIESLGHALNGIEDFEKSEQEARKYKAYYKASEQLVNELRQKVTELERTNQKLIEGLE